MNKYLIAFTLLLSLNSAAVILSPGQVIGFSDSSFNYDSQVEANQAEFCFFKDFEKACDEIRTASYKMNGSYHQGGHDRMKLLSCDLSYGDSHYLEDEVKVSYELTDDYGGYFLVTRTLKSCTRSRLLQ